MIPRLVLPDAHVEVGRGVFNFIDLDILVQTGAKYAIVTQFVRLEQPAVHVESKFPVNILNILLDTANASHISNTLYVHVTFLNEINKLSFINIVQICRPVDAETIA